MIFQGLLLNYIMLFIINIISIINSITHKLNDNNNNLYQSTNNNSIDYIPAILFETGSAFF